VVRKSGEFGIVDGLHHRNVEEGWFGGGMPVVDAPANAKSEIRDTQRNVFQFEVVDVGWSFTECGEQCDGVTKNIGSVSVEYNLGND
jgi:hypothetical protein